MCAWKINPTKDGTANLPWSMMTSKKKTVMTIAYRFVYVEDGDDLLAFIF
jgi:hypothetical protein